MRIDGPTWNGAPTLDLDDKYRAITLYFSPDDDDDTKFVVIPLDDVTVSEELLFVGNAPKFEIDWEGSIQALQKAIDILKAWIAEIERQIELYKKEQAA